MLTTRFNWLRITIKCLPRFKPRSHHMRYSPTIDGIRNVEKLQTEHMVACVCDTTLEFIPLKPRLSRLFLDHLLLRLTTFPSLYKLDEPKAHFYPSGRFLCLCHERIRE